jgi:hypothetical protein
MRKVNVSSVRTYRQIGAPATNQRKRKSTLFRTRTTGAASEDRPDEQGENVVQDQEITGVASEDRPDEQGETLFSSRKDMTKTTPKAKNPSRRK